jgi:putative cell wall-binding protein
MLVRVRTFTDVRPRLNLVLLVCAALVGSVLIRVAPPAASSTAPEVVRLAGADRFETSARIAAATFPDGAPVVLLASGRAHPDALAGGAASGGRGPLLLVEPDEIPEAVASELARLAPIDVLVLGGTDAVSDGVLESASQITGATARRIGGPDRFATAAAISRTFFERADVVYVATGADFADALAAGVVAGVAGAPVLLAEQGALPSATTEELERLDPDRIVVVGGPAALGAQVVQELGALAPTERIGGSDRYATAAALARSGFVDAGTVFVASGTSFADALGGTPAAIAEPGPLLLVGSGPVSLGRSTDAVVTELLDEVERLDAARIVVLGGPAAVSDELTQVLGTTVEAGDGGGGSGGSGGGSVPGVIELEEVAGTNSTRVLGVGDPGGLVRIEGGAFPIELVTGDDGSFAVAVPPKPGTPGPLTVSITSGGRSLVRELPAPAAAGPTTSTVSGRVISHPTGAPLVGATVSHGDASTTTGADGEFSLDGVPAGEVVVTVAAPGHLTTIDLATVSEGGAGDAGDIRIQELAPGREVGPDGGIISGDGWELSVPPGALDSTVAIQVTELFPLGTKDAFFGLPLYDVSPSGLVFTEPVTLRLDNVWGLPAGTALVGLDPDTLEQRPLDAVVTDDTVTVTMDRFLGEEIRAEEEDPSPGPTNKFGGNARFCTPFDSQARASYAYVWTVDMSALFFSTAGAFADDEALKMYNRYLRPRVPTASRTASVPPDDFGDDGESTTASGVFVTQVRAALNDPTASVPGALPELKEPGQPPRVTRMEDFHPVEGHFRDKAETEPYYLAFREAKTTAGILAGGLSGAQPMTPAGVVDVPDDRQFRGQLEWEITALGSRGAIERATATVSGVELDVADAVDFCPGGAGEGAEEYLTVPMSRLEVTPYDFPGTSTDGDFWAAPILFDVTGIAFDQHDGTVLDVTKRYDNDVDGDGVPDRQPYYGADFDLDNCPDDANPNQVDSDDDGDGDACDPIECEEGDDICELPRVTSEYLTIVTSGSFGNPGSTGTVNLNPTVPACHEWPFRSNWSPAPCYVAVSFGTTSSQCIYKDPDTDIYHEIRCSDMYSEHPGWISPPVSLESDTYVRGGTPPTPSCGASGNFQTFIYGGWGTDPNDIWSARGPSALECRITWNADRPDNLLGPTWIRVSGSVRGPLTPDGGFSDFSGLASSWIRVDGDLAPEE